MVERIIAVDVGTGSARAGVFDLSGAQLARKVVPIGQNQPHVSHYEQDSEEIWQAVVQCVRAALLESGTGAGDAVAIGFDATCSLVFRDDGGSPVSVTASSETRFDTLMWLDHRAAGEAGELSVIDDPLVTRFGGRLSPEMQLPKLLWFKRNLPERWARAHLVFDLCDFLNWRATGLNIRSHSPLASKWGYEPAAPGARPDASLQRFGLEDLAQRAGLPDFSHPAATPVGRLSGEAAAELGLTERCLVAPGLIDAYAGASGVFLHTNHGELDCNAALVAGTSSCIVTLSTGQHQHPGCWGAFRDAALPGLWLMEAGQSASGALLDHILRMHPAGGAPTPTLHLAVLNHIAEQLLVCGRDYGLPLAILPDFHGVRSPLSEPHLRGVIAGLSLDASFDGLARLYWRACVALACGIRHVIEHMPGSEQIETLLMTGGFAAHPVIPQLYADVTGLQISVDDTRDAVLLGTAFNAALSSGAIANQSEFGVRPSTRARVISPDPAARDAVERDYRIYHAMLRHRAEIENLLGDGR